MVGKILDDAPPRTPAELDHLQTPREPVTREILRLLPAIKALPLQGEAAKFTPVFMRAVEDMALDCERQGEYGDKARALSRVFLDALRAGLARGP